MDVPTILTTPGVALTSTQRDADFAVITGHQITRADFADTYAWGVDIDMDGFGFTTVRHMNGYVVFADQFLDGDDAAAIQAALLFLEHVGGGILVVPPGVYDMDDGVELVSNVWICGFPGSIFRRTAGGNTLHGEDVEYVRISGIHFQGGSTGSEGIYIEGVNHLLIEDNIFGAITGNTQRHDNGCITVTAGTVITTPTNITIRANTAYYEGPFILVDTCHEVSILENRYYTPGVPAGSNYCIDTYYCDRLLIEGNYLWNYSDSYVGCTTAIAVRGPGAGTLTSDFTVRDNIAVGCGRGANIYHVCYIIEAEFGLIEGNEFWNAGSSGGVGGAPWQCNCLHLISNCNAITVDDNVLTTVDSSKGGPGPTGSQFGFYVDTSTCTQIILKDNFLEALSDDQPNTTFHHGLCDLVAPQGAGLMIAGPNPGEVMRKGNIIIMDHQGQDAPRAGAAGWPASGVIDVIGVRNIGTDANRRNQIDSIALTVEVSTAAWRSVALETTGIPGAGVVGDNELGLIEQTARLDLTANIHWRIHA